MIANPGFAMLTPTLLLLVVPSIQEPGTQDPVEATPAEDSAAVTNSASSEALRTRIHDMRMSLLLGGKKVRKAEDEASNFYGGKVDLVDQRLDTVNADLVEKRASYDLLLKRALESEDPVERKKAMGDAAHLRAEITTLEMESGDLNGKRGKLSELITAIDDRDRERERLAAQIETSDALQFEFGLPLASVGLAPDLPPAQAGSPLENQALIEDLMAVDPRGARSVLWEMDPVGYWQLFPLNPPAPGVVAAFGFPLPDLERSR